MMDNFTIQQNLQSVMDKGLEKATEKDIDLLERDLVEAFIDLLSKGLKRNPPEPQLATNLLKTLKERGLLIPNFHIGIMAGIFKSENIKDRWNEVRPYIVNVLNEMRDMGIELSSIEDVGIFWKKIDAHREPSIRRATIFSYNLKRMEESGLINLKSADAQSLILSLNDIAFAHGSDLATKMFNSLDWSAQTSKKLPVWFECLGRQNFSYRNTFFPERLEKKIAKGAVKNKSVDFLSKKILSSINMKKGYASFGERFDPRNKKSWLVPKLKSIKYGLENVMLVLDEIKNENLMRSEDIVDIITFQGNGGNNMLHELVRLENDEDVFMASSWLCGGSSIIAHPGEELLILAMPKMVMAKNKNGKTAIDFLLERGMGLNNNSNNVGYNELALINILSTTINVVDFSAIYKLRGGESMSLEHITSLIIEKLYKSDIISESEKIRKVEPLKRRIESLVLEREIMNHAILNGGKEPIEERVVVAPGRKKI